MELFPSSSHTGYRIPLVDWLERVLQAEMRHRARGVFAGTAAQIPELVRYRITPQTPPHHAEGPHLASHVERMLACVLAIEEGAKLTDVEEFMRDPGDRLAIAEIEETIREHAAFFKVYALVHDIAKPDVVSFSAPEGSRGALEGFFQHKRRSEAHASPKEVARYDKLLRAYGAAHPQLSDDELSMHFFAEYQVSAHYEDHDRRGAGATYARVRAAALDLFGVGASFHKLLAELVWSHMDAIRFFSDAKAPAKYAFFEAGARKHGMNADVFLTFLAASVLLDAVLGSLYADHEKVRPDASLLLHVFASEREALPARSAVRFANEERKRKQAIKDILSQAKLGAEDVFALIPTGFGPERGVIMHAVYELVRGKEPTCDFGKHSEELTRRASMARHELARRGLDL